MRITSIIVLVIAVAFGVIGVMGVRTYIQSQQMQAAPVDQDEVKTSTTIVVARAPLEFGTELQPDMLREVPWAAPERPEGSFAKIPEILSGERRVALKSVAPGELILQDKISGFGGRATLSQIIEPGMRAVTIRVNDVSGTAGFILPGDRVDVLATIQPTGNRIDTKTDIILEDVRVLAVDQILDDTQEGAVLAKATTVEVSAEEAQKIALASTIGSLSLSLRNIGASAMASGEIEDDGPSRSIGYEDLRSEVTRRPAPTRTSVRSAPVRQAAPAPSPFTTMRVVRGTESSSATVLKDRAEGVAKSTARSLETSSIDLLGAPSSGGAAGGVQ